MKKTVAVGRQSQDKDDIQDLCWEEFFLKTLLPKGASLAQIIHNKQHITYMVQRDQVDIIPGAMTDELTENWSNIEERYYIYLKQNRGREEMLRMIPIVTYECSLSTKDAHPKKLQRRSIKISFASSQEKKRFKKFVRDEEERKKRWGKLCKRIMLREQWSRKKYQCGKLILVVDDDMTEGKDKKKALIEILTDILDLYLDKEKKEQLVKKWDWQQYRKNRPMIQEMLNAVIDPSIRGNTIGFSRGDNKAKVNSEQGNHFFIRCITKEALEKVRQILNLSHGSNHQINKQSNRIDHIQEILLTGPHTCC